ncbi:MAG TPA: hypothetical protein VGK30_21245 [Candidatus Binatia bacterium]|jgi:hypothetical protein
MRKPSAASAAILAAALVVLARLSHAADQPIDAQSLVLKRSATKAKLAFVTHDPGFLFPTVGGLDDPATGSPGGLTIELFSAAEGSTALIADPGAGNPGWTVKATGTPTFKFKNPLSALGTFKLKAVVLKQGKVLKITAKDVGSFALGGPQGAVGVRITTGTLRNCVRFDGATIRKDVAGSFVAHNAVGATLADCSDTSLEGMVPDCGSSAFPACDSPCPGDGVCTGGLGVCKCVSPSSPCGDTDPVCNGTCGAGEECAAVGPGPYRTCVCIPTGSTPCGDPGAPVCGGACPSGRVCRPAYALPVLGGALGCGCELPGECGQGGADCPSGFACGIIPPGTYLCAPIHCGGSAVYPTCGGTCVSGAGCQPVKIDAASYTDCVCAVPASCDAGCGGLTCGSGDVCTIASDGTCGCGAP